MGFFAIHRDLFGSFCAFFCDLDNDGEAAAAPAPGKKPTRITRQAQTHRGQPTHLRLQPKLWLWAMREADFRRARAWTGKKRLPLQRRFSWKLPALFTNTQSPASQTAPGILNNPAAFAMLDPQRRQILPAPTVILQLPLLLAAAACRRRCRRRRRRRCCRRSVKFERKCRSRVGGDNRGTLERRAGFRY